ncbi:hypothetical protein IKF15_01275 [Candidatus Saccharibacteria bacterium]|nr:hypothetical protein [Candidatus Saccharibacteria bacterium]
MAIPKKIHYVWVGNAEISERDKKFIADWQILNPDYEIRRWSERDIDLKEYPLVAQAIQEKRWALASDIIRMYAVFCEGGFYLDTDVELLRPLNDLEQYNAVAGWESSTWFTTAVFGARKHSPWIQKVLQRYHKATIHGKIKTETFLKTVHSLSIYAQDFIPLRSDGKTRIYDGQFAVFAREVFCPKHYATGELKITENTRAIHHYESTWHNKAERLQSTLGKGAFKLAGERGVRPFEKIYHKNLERKIRKELN